MTKPGHPSSETERLEALRGYDVLDTPAEKDFDDLVELAAHICGAPIAMITFVDDRRQWSKAAFGIAPAEDPREISFCAHAIHYSGVFVVPDATKDERFAGNPLVTGSPGIRFYAGSPLVTPDGHALGTLCVIDREPRRLEPAHEKALAVLSRHVMAQLELRRQSREMARINNALLGILEDERLTEAALRESEELNRAVLDSVATQIAVLDHDGNILSLNEAWRQFTAENAGTGGQGLALATVGTNYLQTCRSAKEGSTRVNHAAYNGLRAVLDGDQESFTVEYPFQSATGQHWFILSATPLSTSKGGATIALHDVSERKRIEQQFLRSQRMESIGTLAGGIAHDLNNVLGPIMLSIELLKQQNPAKDAQRLISVLESGAQRGADMVRQVLSFARGVEGKRMELQIKHLVQDIEKIANDTFLKNIRVQTILPHDLWTVLGDPTQLHQVLLNLVVNARDAMPTGGTLTLTAENVIIDAHYAGMNPEAKPGPYLLLGVEDTGTGIPPAVIERIFDPFFTTKEPGKGTGLGLSTTLAIVRSHGGFMRVYSEPGKGTRFKIYLPGQTEPSAEALAEAQAEMPRGNGELLLVVDDEAAVRQVTQETLEAFGYRILLANDGAEAIAIFALRRSEVAGVLTDMMMPVMDGPATIRALRKLAPALPIVAASGLGLNSQVALAAGLGVKYFLPKPYSAETLLKTLHEALRAASHA